MLPGNPGLELSLSVTLPGNISEILLDTGCAQSTLTLFKWRNSVSRFCLPARKGIPKRFANCQNSQDLLWGQRGFLADAAGDVPLAFRVCVSSQSFRPAAFKRYFPLVSHLAVKISSCCRKQKENRHNLVLLLGFSWKSARSWEHFSVAVVIVVRQSATNLLIYVKKFSKFWGA